MKMTVLKAYNFKGKDPVIDELRTLTEDHFGSRVHRKHLKQMSQDGGPSAAAMAGWFFGKTLRPQNPTIEAAGRSLGFKRAWQRMSNAELAKIK